VNHKARRVDVELLYPCLSAAAVVLAYKWGLRRGSAVTRATLDALWTSHTSGFVLVMAKRLSVLEHRALVQELSTDLAWREQRVEGEH
jgi:hypothetical protein